MMTSRARWWIRAIGLGLLSGAVLAGACKLSFLCDDAFITFRHVSNAMDGHGLVWNAPPFRPVEGYTSFLWAMLLWLCWGVFGVEPPAAANVLSIVIGLVTFHLAAVAAFRLRRADGSRPHDAVVFVGLAVLAGNRCFLQWLTGGLETALFNLGFLAWVLCAFRTDSGRGARWLLLWSLAASLTALTRPDGLLLVAATAATATLTALQRRRSWRDTIVGCLPFSTVLAHVLWRRAYYGEWLPNTYYAKVTAPWPEAGVRYLYCFAFEQGLWLWLLLVAAALAVVIGRRQLPWSRLPSQHLAPLAAIAATLFHVGYYVFRVGGDHFEYRVFSYLVPLVVLSAMHLLLRASAPMWLAITGLVLLFLASGVGWLHYALTRVTHPPDYDPLTDKMPAWVQPLTREYDREQLWLQLQFNCIRCVAHQDSLHDIEHGLPTRARMAVDQHDLPVTMSLAVGYPGWVLPDCAVIDLLGLNDWVTARTPTSSWIPTFLPRPALQAVLSSSDTDHDGRFDRDELTAGFERVLACPHADAAGFVRILLLLFARERNDGLTVAESASIEPFLANMRFMAHERKSPPEYVQALDPNVTVEQGKVVVRKRQVPLDAERVRSIETEWRQRVQQSR